MKKTDQVATDLRLILKEEIEEIEDDILNFIEISLKWLPNILKQLW